MRGKLDVIIQKIKLTVSNTSTENQEKEDKPKEEEAKEPVVEEKPRTRSSHPKEAAPAFMSNVFALLDVYLTKMLVRPHNPQTETERPL